MNISESSSARSQALSGVRRSGEGMTPPARMERDTILVPIGTGNRVVARARGPLVAAYRAAWILPYKILHSRRYASARRRVSRMGRPKSILVVCHGNICRSPYLHAVLQRALPDIAVASAGFVGHDRRVPLLSLEVSARRGIDLSGFRSRPLTHNKVRGADLIIVMDASQANYLERVFRVSPGRIFVAGDLDPARSATRAIQDPWMQSIHVFESSFDRLDRIAATLVSAIKGALPESERAHAPRSSRR